MGTTRNLNGGVIGVKNQSSAGLQGQTIFTSSSPSCLSIITNPNTRTINTVIAAGGGGGGKGDGGGGGAGGVIFQCISVGGAETLGQASIGGGGAGHPAPSSGGAGSNGSNST